MEIIDLNVQSYKKPSPFRPVVVFILGLVVGFALYYIYSQISSTRVEKEVEQVVITESTPAEKPPTVEPTPPSTAEQEPPSIEAQLDSVVASRSPLIFVVDDDKFTTVILNTIATYKPVAVVLRNSSGTLQRVLTQRIIEMIRENTADNSMGFPLIGIELTRRNVSAFPEFLDLPSWNELDVHTPMDKITTIGTLYAQKARELGISLFFGPLIELYMEGKSTGAEKEDYFGESTEAIQIVGLTFAKGIYKGKVLPVVRNFPSKTLAQRKEVKTSIVYALETETSKSDVNQAITQLATLLFPFSEAIHEKLPAVLVSHVAIPLLDEANPYLPSSASQKIVHGLLREKWKYNGLLIAEDIAEFPLAEGQNFPNAVLQMTGVGIDLICTSILDDAELKNIITAIEQNVSEEAKKARNSRLTEALKEIMPLPTKKIGPPTKEKVEPLTVPTEQEPTLLAQEATPTPESPPSAVVEVQSTTPVETPAQEPTSSPTDKPIESSSPVPAPNVEEKISKELAKLAEQTQPEQNKIPEPVQPPTQPAIEAGKATVKEVGPMPTSESSVGPPKPATHAQVLQEKVEKKPDTTTSTPTLSTETKDKEKPVPEAVSIPPGTKSVKHIVEKGENLSIIAKRYSVKASDIALWNNLEDPNKIKFGMELTIYVPENMEVPKQVTEQPKRQPTTERVRGTESKATPTPPQPKPTPPQPQEPNKGSQPTRKRFVPITVPQEDTAPQEQSNATTSPAPDIKPIETTQETELKTEPTTAQPESQSPAGSIPMMDTQETTIYTVKRGDTLDSIARDTRVPKEVIIQMNNLKKPYILPAGRKLKVPKVPKVGIND